MTIHTTHDDVIKRLKRAHGHFSKVIDMLESDAECLVVAQQLHAVVCAISAAKTIHVQDHIEHCLAAVLSKKSKDPTGSIREFKEIAKYL